MIKGTNDFYKSFFEKPWCPLFGELPPIDYDDIPNSQMFICRDIIFEARELWGVLPYGKYDFEEHNKAKSLNTCKKTYNLRGQRSRQTIGDSDFFQWDDDLDIDCMDKGIFQECVLTARAIFECHDSTTQHAIDGWYKKSDGTMGEKNNLFSKREFAIEFVKSFHRHWPFCIDIPDYAILSIFAIAEVWDILEDVLCYDKSEDDTDIVKRTSIAYQLLKSAVQRKKDNLDLKQLRKKKVKNEKISKSVNETNKKNNPDHVKLCDLRKEIYFKLCLTNPGKTLYEYSQLVASELSKAGIIDDDIKISKYIGRYLKKIKSSI